MQERLDKGINIKKAVETRVNGKPQFSDEEFYSCKCKILDLFGQELYGAIQVKYQNTIVFKVRYCKLLEELRKKVDYTVYLNEKKINEEKYKIYHADFSKYYKKYVLLKCNLIK